MNTITLDVDHPNKDRVEYFLNQVSEKLTVTSFDHGAWKDFENAQGYTFQNANKDLTITVVFTDSYAAANRIGVANPFLIQADSNWGVNGDILYSVKSTDEELRSDILGLFAGQE